jgi:nucleoside-diphosphate-sugar epimerase
MEEHQIAGPIVVTGATGFIGRRLVARLLEKEHELRALVLPDEAIEGLWQRPVEVRRGDVRDHAAVEAAMGGARTVFHLAAVVPPWEGPESAYQEVAEKGTRHVLHSAAAQGSRAVLVSSMVVYGHYIGRDVCHEDHPFGRPQGPYSRAKQAQERIARELEAKEGLQLTIVRPTNNYGPGSRPWVDTASEHLRRRRPALIGDGEQNAGLSYVDNVVDLLVRAACNPAAVGRVYNANDELDVTWKRYFSDMATELGVEAPRSIPRWIARVATVSELLWRVLGLKGYPPMTREALNIVGSHHRVPSVRARSELGWEPKVGYEKGFAAVAEYLREKGL